VTTNQCIVPGSTLPSYTSADLFVEGPTQPYQLPLCRIPERGSMPVTCDKYPATPLPLTFQCPAAPLYTYTFGPGQFGTGQYPNNGSVNTYPNNGTTFQAPVQPYTSTTPQGANPPAPPIGTYQAQP
jgi:hypothetical protein